MSNILLFRLPGAPGDADRPYDAYPSIYRELVAGIRNLLDLHGQARLQIEAAILLLQRSLSLIREEISCVSTISVKARLEHELDGLARQLDIAKLKASELQVSSCEQELDQHSPC